MSEPLSNAAQILGAIEKLIKSWALAVTLVLMVAIFVLGREFIWFRDLPTVVSIFGSVGVAALATMTLRQLINCIVLFLASRRFRISHGKLTDTQIAILKYCLSREEPWIEIGQLGQPRVLDDTIHRFLEADLAYMDVNILRFRPDFWKWINPQRRKIIARSIPKEADAYVESIIHEPRNPQSWMR